MSYKGETIWIIGASSGIGKALAMEFAQRGAYLVLSARRSDELEKIAANSQHSITICPLDVTDADALSHAAEKHGPFNRVIYLAALYNPGLIENTSLADANKMIDVNIKGALNTINAVYPSMRKSTKSQIVLCGSVAGYCGLPNSQPYSLTKAAIINLSQSLYIEAKQHNIDVKLISPGFVRTPLTDKNDFKMPMIIEPEDAARIIADKLQGSSFEIHFPRKFTWIVKILAALPYWLYFKIAKNILKNKLKS